MSVGKRRRAARAQQPSKVIRQERLRARFWLTLGAPVPPQIVNW